ncbi:hypothetical protein PGTUg99_005663 [Puccinia graminis f. sp. tritici]|uniref:Uncharacterized protein n=1 Tax=Puccinia graminis f. sp. tritici TaxID=56615 RepID=A0A5B0Q8P7_PUCGR|nr:hypothetical protein PGTUg99_005663 [Puccinia graminis f. sp. tritici]
MKLALTVLLPLLTIIFLLADQMHEGFYSHRSLGACTQHQVDPVELRTQHSNEYNEPLC